MNGQKSVCFFLDSAEHNLEFSNVPPYVMLWITKTTLEADL